MEVVLWAPPNLSRGCVREKVNEWRQKNPNTPPYERFLQDYISSHWPVFWHLKRKFVLDLSQEGSSDDPDDPDEEVCSICRCSLGLGTETMNCNHRFHTMCIHRWMQRSGTCPMCRASL
jgi:hypothetical protein